MQINGMKAPIAFATSILLGGIWLGVLSNTVSSNEDDQEKIKAKVEQTALDVAAMKKDIEYTKEAVDDLKEQQSKNQEAILKAIRDEAI